MFSESEIASLFTKDFLEEIALAIDGFSGRTLVKMLNHLAGLRAGLGGKPLSHGVLRAGMDRFIEREQEAAKLLKN